jgi:hypothetical protein
MVGCVLGWRCGELLRVGVRVHALVIGFSSGVCVDGLAFLEGYIYLIEFVLGNSVTA